jgi:hypothetical protein
MAGGIAGQGVAGMSNLSSENFVECTAMDELIRLLGMEKIVQLADLLGEVSAKTGYGDVKIVVAEGRVTTLKQEISYK